MDTEIKIGRKLVTFEDASEGESDAICMIEDANLDEKQCDYLEARTTRITQLVAHHLGIKSHHCQVLAREKWMPGRFNLCIPVGVSQPGKPITVVAFRCPKIHRIRTTVDEKMRAEIGAQVWIEEHCPNINTPHLIGFRLMNGFRFTHSRHRPPIQRLLHALVRKIRQWLDLPILSAYIRTHSSKSRSNTIGPYMISQWIPNFESQMLSNTWYEEKHDVEKREHLFRGLARIILDLARIPQRRIGSLRFYDSGVVSLSGRYLSMQMAHFENQGCKHIITPGTTYECCDAFIADLITARLDWFLSLRSRAYSKQLIVDRIAMVALLPDLSDRYLNKDRQCGPFTLQLSDLHRSNMFVDADWNITHVIDLEWTNATPTELPAVPPFLLEEIADVIEGDEQAVSFFNETFSQFCRILREEEAKMTMDHDISIADAMEDTLSNKSLFFWYGLCSEYDLDISVSMEPYKSMIHDQSWSLAESVVPNIKEFAERKMDEYFEYEQQLRVHYGIPEDAVLWDSEGSTAGEEENDVEAEENGSLQQI